VHPRTRSAPPSQSNSQFLGQFLLGGLDLEVYLEATTKKVVNFFWQEKVHPRQNPGYIYADWCGCTVLSEGCPTTIGHDELLASSAHFGREF